MKKEPHNTHFKSPTNGQAVCGLNSDVMWIAQWATEVKNDL